MSTTYSVQIELTSKGDLVSQLGGATGKALTLDSGISKLRDGFTGLIEKAGAVAVEVGKWAALGAFGAVTFGIMKVNNELEKTQISLAAIFGANGFSKTMPEGMNLAAGTMEKMRKDAAALPGEFSDLMGIFRAISVPGFQSGASIEKLEDFSAKTMAVGAVMNLPQEVVAREMAMLLEGRAGAHNMLGLRLAGLGGDAAKEFNQKSSAERLAFLSAELEKYSGAIDVYRHSFDGLSSTLVDNVKNFGRLALGGLFDRLKSTLEEINDWFGSNELAVSNFAAALGSKISYAWDFGVQKVKEWGPLVIEFASAAYDRLVQIWEKIQPYVVRFADALKSALSDPNGTLDKIQMVLGLYAAVKVGGGLIGALGGPGAIVGGIGSAVRGVGAAASAGYGALAGEGLGAAGAFGAVTAVGTIAAVVAALGGLALATDQGIKLQGESSKMIHADAIARREAGERLLNGMDDINYSNAEYQRMMVKLIQSGDELQASLLLAAGAAKEEMAAKQDIADRRLKEDEEYHSDRLTQGITGMVQDFLAGRKREEQKQPKHPGGAGVHVNKVEINVASNEDPSRIAYKVADIFTHLKRNPRTSPYMQNFSAN